MSFKPRYEATEFAPPQPPQPESPESAPMQSAQCVKCGKRFELSRRALRLLRDNPDLPPTCSGCLGHVKKHSAKPSFTADPSKALVLQSRQPRNGGQAAMVRAMGAGLARLEKMFVDGMMAVDARSEARHQQALEGQQRLRDDVAELKATAEAAAERAQRLEQLKAKVDACQRKIVKYGEAGNTEKVAEYEAKLDGFLDEYDALVGVGEV